MNCYVTATEFKQNLSHYLSNVSDSPVHITKNGKVVAVLVSPEIKKEIAFRSLKGILPEDITSLHEIRNERLEKYL